MIRIAIEQSAWQFVCIIAIGHRGERLMEDNDYVLAFDHFYTTNHIQILKSALPFIGQGNPGMMPALIKYMEFKYTLSLINQGGLPPGGGIRACSEEYGPKSGKDPYENMENFYKAVRRYLSPNEERGFQQMMSAINTMKNMREMQQMMEIFQNISPDMDLSSMTANMQDGAGPGGININEMMEIMKMFGG